MRYYLNIFEDPGPFDPPSRIYGPWTWESNAKKAIIDGMNNYSRSLEMKTTRFEPSLKQSLTGVTKTSSVCENRYLII